MVHPIVIFCYFLGVLFCSMWFTHPILLAVSLFGAVSTAAVLKLKTTKVLPIFLLAVVLNPLFSHEGVTVLFYLPSGNPYTLESLLYGGKVALTLMTTVCWCFSFHHVMTSEKLHCIFSRIAPILGLVFSQILALIPRFLRQSGNVLRAQAGLGEERGKLKRAGDAFSSLTTWGLEHAGETADSMKARGYGLPGRTSFTPYRFKARDAILLALLALIFAGSLLSKSLVFRYFPSVRFESGSIGIFGAVCFLILCIIPTVWEVRKWNR